MIVTEIIARLLAEAAPPFGSVQGAADLASALKAGAPAAPSAYVFIAEEASAENERLTGVLQRTEIDVSVVIAVGNVADSHGGAAAADLEALKKAVRDALIGWQPASAEDVLTHVGGRMGQFRDGTAWWEMTLGTAIYLEAT